MPLMPWGWIVAAGALVTAGVKLLAVAVSGQTAHEDGGQVFCRVKADTFTRSLFAGVGAFLLAVAAFIILIRFGFFF